GTLQQREQQASLGQIPCEFCQILCDSHHLQIHQASCASKPIINFREHFPLSSARGYFCTNQSLYEKLVSAQKCNTSFEELKCERNKLPPLKKPLIGEYIGIQGESNSGYLDATLYWMFAYNDVFDKLIYSPEVKNRQCMDYVSCDAILDLRHRLGKATKDHTFFKDEKDRTEFLRACEKLFHYSPIKTIHLDEKPKDDGSNITSNFVWECFDDNFERQLSTNVQNLFKNSLDASSTFY
ncbi:unnamed protein product, partial [Didymodactylos carnosus]